jgi:hypothetical protein
MFQQAEIHYAILRLHKPETTTTLAQDPSYSYSAHLDLSPCTLASLMSKDQNSLTLHPLVLVKRSIIVIGKWISERIIGVQQS